MTGKSNTHAVHAQPTPGASHTQAEAVGWTVASIFIITIPLLCLAFAIAVIRFIWKRSAVALLLVALPLFGQSKVETIANFGLRAADTASTCYFMHINPTQREYSLPTQSCAGVAAWNAGFATGAYFVDRWLTKRGHSRWAHFQVVSGGGSSVGLAYTFTHSRY